VDHSFFHFDIVLSVHFGFTASDYPFVFLQTCLLWFQSYYSMCCSCVIVGHDIYIYTSVLLLTSLLFVFPSFLLYKNENFNKIRIMKTAIKGETTKLNTATQRHTDTPTHRQNRSKIIQSENYRKRANSISKDKYTGPLTLLSWYIFVQVLQ
jgi:hypothetical protein